jgi:cell division protein FtsX
MDWGNSHFGKNQDTKPSRVIIRTKDPGNPGLVQYLKEKNLATDADKTRFSRYRQVVELVVNISWITGAIMLVFAMLIFTLFIQLTIASCKEEIVLLITLGASPKQLTAFFNVLMNQTQSCGFLCQRSCCFYQWTYK